jgi:hypothetical protein
VCRDRGTCERLSFILADNAIHQLSPDGRKQQHVSESMIEQGCFVSDNEPTGIAGIGPDGWKALKRRNPL